MITDTETILKHFTLTLKNEEADEKESNQILKLKLNRICYNCTALKMFSFLYFTN